MSTHRRSLWLSIITLVALIFTACGAPTTPAATAPTTAPAAPTSAPAEPTTAPAEPTVAPAEPTVAPTEVVEPTTAPTTAAAEPTTAPAAAGAYHEAPMLAALVASGDLPPVAERLPKDVLVLQPEDSTGTYGGKLRAPHAWDAFFEQGLVQRLHNDRETFVPQVAKEWAWADDFTSIIFKLREGMKWSDGQPYTADDILFWWNDIVKSKYNVQPYTVSGMNTETDNVVKVDATTVRFEFAESRPTFLEQSRGAWSYGFYGYPAHYFKQIHPDYDGTAADKAQEQFQKLLDVLYQNQWISTDINAPTINAWKVTQFKKGEYALFERNPYYFGVDADGNQLPYIDAIEGLDKYDQDAELLKTKTLAGEVDMLFRIIRPSDFPVFKEKEQELGLQLLLFDDVFNGRQTFMINQESKVNEPVAKLLQTVEFRRALSLALDRDLMNESIYQGLGKPGHGFSGPGIFDDAIDGAYATLDPEQANALLDGIGLDKRDADGLRTLPDGTPLTIDLLYRTGWGAGVDETVSIAVDNWREIGLRVAAKPAEPKLFSERVTANDWEIKLNPNTGGWTGYWRFGMALNFFASDSWKWMETASSAQQEGQEPQGKVKELADLQQTAYSASDKAAADAAYQEYRAILADQLFEIGTVSNTPAILLLNAKLRNVPGQTKPAAISQGESEYLRFEQWYYAP